MGKPTDTYLNLERMLGEPLADYVASLRGDERSWPYIARKLYDRTGFTVSDETLRVWFTEPAETSAA